MRAGSPLPRGPRADCSGYGRGLLLGLALTAAAVVLAPPVPAQTARGHFRGARLPPAGEAWLEVAPASESWHTQYALDSPSDAVADGSEEPLSADVDGPIADRLYPGASPFVAGLRQDAPALGYDSLPGGEFALGGLDVERLQAERQVVPVSLEIGILDRLAARVTVPLVKTTTEAFFRFDSAAATFAPFPAAVPEPDAFATAWASARQSLESQLEEGSLSEEERARARSLLESSGAFLEAFRRRADAGLLFPLGQGRPGTALTSHVDSLGTAFRSFGIDAPSLQLSGTATSASLQSFFVDGPMDADSLGGRDRGWTVEGAEVGVRVGLLDTFRPVADTSGGGLELRTTVGAALRLPRGPSGEAPFVTPASFLDVPVSEAQTDVEVSVQQDLKLGPVVVAARGRYGRQLSDELELRVHRPDRPFPLPSTTATVERDLGDYLEAHLSPRLAMNRSISIGAEYSYWRKEADRYALVSGPDDDLPEDAEPLAVESAERRHRLGVGVHYRAVGDSTSAGDRPVEVSFLYQAPVAGAGGQTPVSRIVSFRLRVPVGRPGLPLP